MPTVPHSPLPLERHKSPYTFLEKVKRVLWTTCESTAFRWSWPTWYRYRAWLLRCFGADIDPRARIRRTCLFTCPWNLKIGADTATGERVWFYCLGAITIGKRVTVSHEARLCAGTHDFDQIAMPLLRLPIMINDDAWIASSTFIGPNVEVGKGAILGAAGCTFKNLDAWTVYCGNPAQRIKERKRLDSV